jgi:hypothetical protein
MGCVLKKEAESENEPRKVASRGDLSHMRPKSDRMKQLADKTIFFGSKGFYGTPLPLIPDIRSSEVSVGLVGKLLDAFGISKKFERLVSLKQGPNKRMNRYLVYQYKRLIKSIDGELVSGDSNKQSHIN